MRGSWLMLVFGGVLQAQVELVLRITDQQGIPLHVVHQGEPFVVCVTMMGALNNQGEPRIEHCEKCALFERRPVLTSVSMVNGQQSSFKKYSYTARIDALGDYALGPAVLIIGNQRVQSNAVAFRVAKAEAAPAPDVHTKRPFLLAHVHKREAYVGERIVLTLRLCVAQEIKQLALEPITLTHMTLQPMGTPYQEPYVVAGVQWQSMVYRFAVYAHQPGIQLIPRITMHCQIEREDTSFFARFFGGAIEMIDVHASPIELTVKPLPTAQTVDGVGHFDHFQLTADHTTVSAAQAAVLTLGVTGNGCLDHVFKKPLEGIPACLTLYDSTVSIIPDEQHEGVATKKREWVVQGTQPGTYTIPAQTFTVFDPVCKQYVALKTTPITLTFLSDQSHAASIDCPQPPVPQPKLPVLPWEVFSVLAVLPIALIIGAYGWYRYRAPTHITYAHIRRMVVRACKHHDACGVYNALLVLVSYKTARPVSCITAQQVIDFGEKMFHTKQLQNQWQRFVCTVQGAAFAASHDEGDQVIAQALVWLKLIKEHW